MDGKHLAKVSQKGHNLETKTKIETLIPMRIYISILIYIFNIKSQENPSNGLGGVAITNIS